MQRSLGKALACLLVLGLVAAGTAGAAALITGKDIVNGTVTGADLKQGTVKLGDLSAKAKASLAGVPGPAGATGPAGPAGPQGAAGPQGEAGSADRYAEIASTGELNDDVKNIAQSEISHPAAGVYCFTFPADNRPVAGAANALDGDVFTTMNMEPEGGLAGCPAAAQVKVETWDISSGGNASRSFRVILEND